MFMLARDLGMRVRDVESWSAGELAEWQAFYSYEHKMREAAQRKAKAEAKARR